MNYFPKQSGATYQALASTHKAAAKAFLRITGLRIDLADPSLLTPEQFASMDD